MLLGWPISISWSDFFPIRFHIMCTLWMIVILNEKYHPNFWVKPQRPLSHPFSHFFLPKYSVHIQIFIYFGGIAQYDSIFAISLALYVWLRWSPSPNLPKKQTRTSANPPITTPSRSFVPGDDDSRLKPRAPRETYTYNAKNTRIYSQGAVWGFGGRLRALLGYGVKRVVQQLRVASGCLFGGGGYDEIRERTTHRKRETKWAGEVRMWEEWVWVGWIG